MKTNGLWSIFISVRMKTNNMWMSKEKIRDFFPLFSPSDAHFFQNFPTVDVAIIFLIFIFLKSYNFLWGSNNNFWVLSNYSLTVTNSIWVDEVLKKVLNFTSSIIKVVTSSFSFFFISFVEGIEFLFLTVPVN